MLCCFVDKGKDKQWSSVGDVGRVWWIIKHGGEELSSAKKVREGEAPRGSEWRERRKANWFGGGGGGGAYPKLSLCDYWDIKTSNSGEDARGTRVLNSRNPGKGSIETN